MKLSEAKKLATQVVRAEIEGKPTRGHDGRKEFVLYGVRCTTQRCTLHVRLVWTVLPISMRRGQQIVDRHVATTGTDQWRESASSTLSLRDTRRSLSSQSSVACRVKVT